MRFREGLDTTGVSDLASAWGRSWGNKDQSERSYHLHYREPCAPASFEHARRFGYWLRLACSGWPVGFISTCSIYLRSVDGQVQQPAYRKACTCSLIGNYRNAARAQLSPTNQRQPFLSLRNAQHFWFVSGTNHTVTCEGFSPESCPSGRLHSSQ